jgi:hypothetical protein
MSASVDFFSVCAEKVSMQDSGTRAHMICGKSSVFLRSSSRVLSQISGADQYRIFTHVVCAASTSVARGCTGRPFVTKGKQQDGGSCGRSQRSRKHTHTSGTTLAPTTIRSSFRSRWQTETIPIWRRVAARSLRVSWVNFGLVSAAQRAREGGVPHVLSLARAPFQTTCSYPTRISGVATVDEE